MSKHKRKGAIIGLFNDQCGLCCYCSRKMTLQFNKKRTATVEHIIPKSKNGRVLSAACNNCNQKKSDTSLIMFLWANPRLAA